MDVVAGLEPSDIASEAGACICCDFVAGVALAEGRELVLSLSPPSFSLGNGGKATARRCLLLLPAAGDALFVALLGASLFALSCSGAPSPLPSVFPLRIYGSSGNSGEAGAIDGASASCSTEVLNVRRRNPGRPRGCCGVLAGCDAMLCIFVSDLDLSAPALLESTPRVPPQLQRRRGCRQRSLLRQGGACLVLLDSRGRGGNERRCALCTLQLSAVQIRRGKDVHSHSSFSVL